MRCVVWLRIFLSVVSSSTDGHQLEAFIIVVGIPRWGGDKLIKKIFVKLDVRVTVIVRFHELLGLRFGVVLRLRGGLWLFHFLRADGRGNFFGLCFHFLLREGTEVCLLCLSHQIASLRLANWSNWRILSCNWKQPVVIENFLNNHVSQHPVAIVSSTFGAFVASNLPQLIS